MFGIITNPIKNVLGTTNDLIFEGKVPTQRELIKLVEDGMTLYAISDATGIAVETLQEIGGFDDG